MPKKRIPHIIDDDGVEKKLCSNCKQYKSLDEYNYKADRYDRLSNECIRCLSERNKRRHDNNFRFPDWVQTREEIETYLNKCRYKKQRDIKDEIEKERKENKEEYHELEIQKENKPGETPNS